jgi:hypothetical protein
MYQVATQIEMQACRCITCETVHNNEEVASRMRTRMHTPADFARNAKPKDWHGMHTSRDIPAVPTKNYTKHTHTHILRTL